jgi:hypothetical protein
VGWEPARGQRFRKGPSASLPACRLSRLLLGPHGSNPTNDQRNPETKLPLLDIDVLSKSHYYTVGGCPLG